MGGAEEGGTIWGGMREGGNTCVLDLDWVTETVLNLRRKEMGVWGLMNGQKRNDNNTIQRENRPKRVQKTPTYPLLDSTITIITN